MRRIDFRSGEKRQGQRIQSTTSRWLKTTQQVIVFSDEPQRRWLVIELCRDFFFVLLLDHRWRGKARTHFHCNAIVQHGRRSLVETRIQGGLTRVCGRLNIFVLRRSNDTKTRRRQVLLLSFSICQRVWKVKNGWRRPELYLINLDDVIIDMHLSSKGRERKVHHSAQDHSPNTSCRSTFEQRKYMMTLSSMRRVHRRHHVH
jgi:hypothetical protein